MRHHRKQINIRLLRAKVYGKPSRTDVIRAMQHMLDHGEVPKGWKLAVINWSAARGGGLIAGTIEDMDTFRPVIEAALHGARISLVRDGDAR